MGKFVGKRVVYSDIDGTLIDFHTYNAAIAAPWISRLADAGIPLILCSSKTRVEQRHLQRTLNLNDPFIVENGSAIIIPEGYFGVDIPGGRMADGYLILELGISSATVRRAAEEASRTTGIPLQGFSDLSVEEVGRITGLDPAAAARARQREYSETIVTPLSPDQHFRLAEALSARGLKMESGGRFYTITATDSHKGAAVRRLTKLYRQEYGAVLTIGIGDSPNDGSMLAAVDQPFLVQRPDGSWCDLPAQRVAGIGPLGWQAVIERLPAAPAD